jgi:small subunit ribosomal protein S7
MSRRHAAGKRDILPDPKFGKVTVSKFVNCLMVDGKKNTAEKIFYGAVEKLEGKVEETSGVEIFTAALENVKPTLEVRSRRVGGSTYQIPVEVRDSRRFALATRWIIEAARKRGGKTMEDNLAAELLDAQSRRGSAFKKREDTHKMADANKAFAHYMW